MARIISSGQGSNIIIDIGNLVNIAALTITDLQVRITNTEPKRILVFEFAIDSKPYRITMHFSDETFYSRTLFGQLKRGESEQTKLQ